MKINNNLQAANAARQLNVNSGSAAKSMEKLSSGYRINKAGDDAAGLAISEKMRGQIRGLNQASKNSQEGISLIQTAEAGLNETHSILQRMRELAVQASTGTLQDEDRQQINKEFADLRSEVDDISSKTQFNKMTLLGGDFGVERTGTLVDEVRDADGVLTSGLAGLKSIAFDGADAGTYTFNNTDADHFTVTNGAGVVVDLGKVADGAGILDVKQFNLKIELTADYKQATSVITDDTLILSGSGVKLQTGANEGDTLDLSIKDMSSKGLGIDTANTNTATAAANAITSVESAIKLVSDERAMLGAKQNRLEYKIKNLNSSAENLQSAESGIRDVDMASEMVEYTKNDILQQAAQAMLAKANQSPQNILQLLR